MKLVFLVLRRLFFSSQSNFLFKTTNIVSIISLAFGIASLNIVLGAVSGFESKVSENYLLLVAIQQSIIYLKTNFQPINH